MAGIGGGLVSAGLGEQDQAAQILGNAAEQEQQRNLGNKQARQAAKAGNVQLGATGGAMAGMYYGASLGPWGALIGGAIGAVAGGLF